MQCSGLALGRAARDTPDTPAGGGVGVHCWRGVAVNGRGLAGALRAFGERQGIGPGRAGSAESYTCSCCKFSVCVGFVTLLGGGLAVR